MWQSSQFLIHLTVHIRLSRTKERFEKGYEQTFIDGIFIVAESGQIPVYHLIDYDHEATKIIFCPEELQKVNPDEDRI